MVAGIITIISVVTIVIVLIVLYRSTSQKHKAKILLEQYQAEEARKKKEELYNKVSSSFPGFKTPSTFKTHKYSQRLFSYDRPLKYQKYAHSLPDKIIEPYFKGESIELQPHSLRDVASEFYSVLIGVAKEQYPEEFNLLLEAYRAAVDDGIIEARNNLAIIYYNYLDDCKKAIEILTPAIMAHNHNSLLTYASISFSEGNEKEYKENLHLACVFGSVYAALDMASIFVEKGEVDKAISCLKVAVYSKIERTYIDIETLPEAIENLYCLMRDNNPTKITECLELFRLRIMLETQQLNYIIDNADIGATDLSYSDNVDFLLEDLPSLSLDEGHHLQLKLSGCSHNYCLQLVGDNQDDCLKNITVDFTRSGILEAFMLSVAGNYMPHQWHSAYKVNTYFVLPEDYDRLISHPTEEDKLNGKMSCGLYDLDPMILMPDVEIHSDNTATLSVWFWNEWKGLVNQINRYRYINGHLSIIESPKEIIKIPFDCGVCF